MSTGQRNKPGPGERNHGAKRKKKWYRDSGTKSKVLPERKAVQPLRPPEDPRYFSANWKLLLETLSPPAVQSVRHNDASEKPESRTSSTRKTGSGPTALQTGPGRGAEVKGAAGVPHRVFRGPAQGPVAPGERQTKVMKKKKKTKQNKKMEDGEQPAKRKRTEKQQKPPAAADLWFDDVDPDDIEAAVGKEAADVVRKRMGVQGHHQDPESALVKSHAFEGLTRAVAMDCEMVGVGAGGEHSVVARVSVVNRFGKCVYDKFVKPSEKVTDFRTEVSGVRPQDLAQGEQMETVQLEVSEILQGRILVGHAVHNDLKVLFLDHPKKNIRDTQKYKPFREIVKSSRPSLKVLCKEILNVKVQQGEHSSVQDAQATMRLYTQVKKQWEAAIKTNRNNKDDKNQRKPK